MNTTSRRAAVDTVERVARTAVQAAAAAWLIDRDVSVAGLKVAGVAALVSLVMCLAGSQVGDKTDAALVDSREV